MTVYKLFSTYFYNEKGFNWVFYEVFDHYTVSDQNQMSPVYLFIYLFIQIQILIGFQANRFVTKYSKKKFMEQIKSMLLL
jgi:hypothetical protein